jgi:hypothetical protein
MQLLWANDVKAIEKPVTELRGRAVSPVMFHLYKSVLHHMKEDCSFCNYGCENL